MGMSGGGGGGPKNDINVTPYIDILLVLLIIFMVITPFTPKGITVRIPDELPEDVDQSIADKFQGIVISFNEHGDPMVGNDLYTWEGLGPQLTQIFSARADKSLFIKGKKQQIFGDVVHAIDVAKGAGVEEIGLMTDLD